MVSEETMIEIEARTGTVETHPDRDAGFTRLLDAMARPCWVERVAERLPPDPHGARNAADPLTEHDSNGEA